MTSAAVASCCVASLLIPTALATLDLGVTKGKGLTAPPTRPWLIHYTVWMSVPATAGA